MLMLPTLQVGRNAEPDMCRKGASGSISQDPGAEGGSITAGLFLLPGLCPHPAHWGGAC